MEAIHSWDLFPQEVLQNLFPKMSNTLVFIQLYELSFKLI